MRLSITEAKRRFSELVERAARGEEIVITCRGKERARLDGADVRPKPSVQEIFNRFARVRIKLPEGTTVKSLIDEGRRF